MAAAASTCWHRPARITHSLARCATLSRFLGERVIRVHHSSESKLGTYFAQGLEHAGSAAPRVSRGR